MKHQALIVVGSLLIVALVLLYFYGVGRRSAMEGFASGKTTLTMYYVDWCPHCQSAKPDFEALKDASPIDVNGQSVAFEMVNPEKTPDLTKGKPIKGYPTILLTKSSGEVVEYDGSRDKDGYMSFLQSNI